MLALSVERSYSSAGIYEKALRAIDPTAAKTKKDRKARLNKRKRVFDAILPGEKIPEKSVYPGLGERWDRPNNNQIGIVVPTHYFEKFCYKVTRGIHFIETGKLIKPPYEISFFPMNSETAGAVSYTHLTLPTILLV